MQFLELEVFTRFGARLEASMEAAIQRGRVLREILKQERFSPLPEAFQMAWLVAFNDGLFDTIELESIAQLLSDLESGLQHASTTLDSPRDQWTKAVSTWLPPAPGGS
ncbi:MAG: hypothetical protein WBN43_09905 [Thiogranum sp.]